ncbi:MAG: exonuclease SbcC, partial [Myxococcaceae bacterium]|nr:exonuclease SbcC [Myxococcaceae bacterium]
MSDELEAQLRAGGAKVSEGVFRIDARRALAKLREFRLAEPHHWVLEVLRAASSVKARTVEVETDTDDIILRFDGKEFAPAVMKDLLAQALDSAGQGDRRSARYLSLGIAGALGLEPKWIKVRSGSVALEIRPPDEVTVSVAATREKGTLVHVRKRFGWSVIKAALADVTPEEQAIVERARRYGPALTHNKKRLGNGELVKGGWVVSSAFEGEGVEVIVGVPASGPTGVVVFDIDGVVVARRELELPGRFLVAWVRSDQMRRNASGSDVVDSDPAVVWVMAKVRALALDVTQKMGALIAAKKAKEVWRTRYRDYALECWADAKLHPEVRPVLAGFPLIPGLYDEWFSPADFEREEKEGRPIYYALETFPRGSYPRPMALLESASGDPIAKLLPARQRTDAAKTVRARARAAEHKHRWLSSPIEAPVLPEGSYLARAELVASGLKGEVGLVESANAGAFVRLLCQGRFVQQGDVSSLEPLRLRAVVDWQKDVPEKLWPEIPSDKLWSLVLEAIESEASKLVPAGLPELSTHAIDLLVRHANKGGTGARLPEALREAKLFHCTDGSKISLAALEEHPTVHFVSEPTDATLLSGAPVLVLPVDLERALGKLATRGLVNARERLEQERAIRDRLAGPRQAAKLGGLRVVVELEAEGVTGQVGLPPAAGSGLELTLLRDGIQIEQTSLTAGYALGRAIVDCKDFVPNQLWDTVVRGPAFERALAAVRAAERRLAAALLSSSPGTLDAMAPGHAQFLVAFMRKHLRGEADPEAAAVEHAPLFRSATGPLSLAALRPQDAGQRLWSLPFDSSEAVPAGMRVMLLRDEHAALLAELLGVRIEDARVELAEQKRRDLFLSRPITQVEPPEGAMLCGAVAAAKVKGVIGLSKEDFCGAWVDVLIHDRFFVNDLFTSNLPLRGVLAIEGVDPALAQLPSDATACLSEAIRLAEGELLGRALAEPAAPGARRAILLALQLRLERNLASRITGDALAELPLFPCTDGELRSARTLDQGKKVLFVTARIDGASISKEPVVVAIEPGLRAALARWPITEDVTVALRRELDARSSRLAIKPLESIALPEAALWRRPLHEKDLEGELGVVSAGGGRLQVLHERRPISMIEGALPAPLAAIVNNDALRLAPFDQGIVLDAPYQAMLERLRVEAEVLLERVADALFAASEEDRRKAAPLLAPLTFWLLSRKKRGARLNKLPLFETTEGSGLSLVELLEE